MSDCKSKDIPSYMMYFDMVNKLEEKNKDKKNFIIKLINKIVDKPIISLYKFKYIHQDDFINDDASYKFLVKYFEYINLMFNLNLIYDESKFNRHNLIELLRLSLKSIDVKLIKKSFDNTITYSII
jgi:hypothetical protein